MYFDVEVFKSLNDVMKEYENAVHNNLENVDKFRTKLLREKRKFVKDFNKTILDFYSRIETISINNKHKFGIIPSKYRLPKRMSDIRVGSIVTYNLGYGFKITWVLCLVTEIVPNTFIKPDVAPTKRLFKYRLKLLRKIDGKKIEKDLMEYFEEYRLSCPVGTVYELNQKKREKYIFDNTPASLKMFVKTVRNHIHYSPNTKFGKEFCLEGQQKLNELKIKNV